MTLNCVVSATAASTNANMNMLPSLKTSVAGRTMTDSEVVKPGECYN